MAALFRAPLRLVIHSVDFFRRGERLLQLRQGEAGSAADIEDRLFTPGDKVHRGGDAGDALRRDDDRALIVGVDDVAVRDPHPAHFDRLAEFDQVDVSVAGDDMSAKNRESFGQQVGVAVCAIGDAAGRAQRLVDRAMHFAPKAAGSRAIRPPPQSRPSSGRRRGRHTLTSRCDRAWRLAEARRPLSVPTRPTPTTGWSPGRAAMRGDLVKPLLRDSGRSISRALQTLAVSNLASASMSARVGFA
jgi:hypothetical protein